MKEEITILGNNGEYEDWDILAIIFLSEEEVINHMKDFFRRTITHKILNPLCSVSKWASNELAYCFDNETCLSDYLERHNYLSGRIRDLLNENHFVPVNENDVNKDYLIIDRKLFIQYLIDKGIKVIEERNMGKIK